MKNTFLRIATVEYVDEETGSGIIKVRLNGDTLKDEYSEYEEKTFEALPYMPLNLHIRPKVGECVYVLLPEIGNNNKNSMKYYIGPIVSQPNHLYEEPSKIGVSTNPSSAIAPGVSISNIPVLKGCFDEPNDVILYGRKNGDIIIGDDNVVIRCDARQYHAEKDKNENHYSFNNENPSYLLLRSNEGTANNGSNAVLVADNISLIGNITGPVDNPTSNDSNKLITNKKLEEILEKASPLPYGDVLVSFLKEFVQVFLNHVHPYPGIVPDPSNSVAHLSSRANTLEDDLLSKNVKIN